MVVDFVGVMDNKAVNDDDWSIVDLIGDSLMVNGEGGWDWFGGSGLVLI